MHAYQIIILSKTLFNAPIPPRHRPQRSDGIDLNLLQGRTSSWCIRDHDYPLLVRRVSASHDDSDNQPATESSRGDMNARNAYIPTASDEEGMATTATFIPTRKTNT